LGHKVHPVGFRLGVVKGWQSRWYAERDYKDLFAEDFKLRKVIHKKLADAAISRIEIERAAANQVAVTIHTAKPGIVIGRSGAKVDELRAQLETMTKKRVRLNIIEIRQPELDAYLVSRSIAEQLEKRVSFRRAMKQAVQKTMRSNAKGIRILVGGRLGGAEIARSEKEVEGKIPLHTLRADIDFGQAEAHTTFGVIGIKVWIYKGDILPDKRREGAEAAPEQQAFVPQREERGDRRGDRRGGGQRGQRSGGERGDRGDRGDRGGDRGPRGERGGERGPRGEHGGERGPRVEHGGERGPRGDRPQGERPQGDRPQGDRPPRQPRGERPQGDRPQGERPQGDRPQGDRPPRQPRGERPQGERPQGERPQGDRPPRQPRGERPAPKPEAQNPAITNKATPPPPPTSAAPETGASESE
jgi:small subunit ribosomal protein S3